VRLEKRRAARLGISKIKEKKKMAENKQKEGKGLPAVATAIQKEEKNSRGCKRSRRVHL